MKRQLSSLFIWSIALLIIALAVANWFLAGTNPGSVDEFDFIWVLPYAVIGLLGALVSTRRPDNMIGWLFLLTGSTALLNGFARTYALHSYLGPRTLPAAATLAWLGFWTWIPSFGLIALSFLLFPTGQPSSRFWAYIIRITWIMIVLSVIAAGLLWPQRGPDLIEATRPRAVPGGVLLDIVANNILPALVILAVISLISRFRRARGVERQQIKWFAFAGSLLSLVLISALFIPSEDPISDPVFATLLMIALTAVPIAVGIAILRYRLYDIDIIIRRTLQYALLTGVLALIYYGGVVLLQSEVGTLTGQTDSPIITVLTTLAIAALFNPLRNRIQEFIDRRFYRQKYDAEQALARFAATARDEVDIDKLTGALLDVIDQTMQPDRASLWIKR